MATFVVLRSRTMSSLLPSIARRTITSLTQPIVVHGGGSWRNLCRLNPCRSVVQPSTTLVRSFGIFGPDKTPLDMNMVESRVLKICGSYDKIDSSSLKLDSHFAKDLGLDSLDHVEVIMAIEDEFSFEIPDKDAEKLWTPADIIKYVADKEEAWRELQPEH